MSPLPPRGIITSTYASIFKSSLTAVLSIVFIIWTMLGDTLLSTSAFLMRLDNIKLLLIASLPPLRIILFPDFNDKPAASIVTFGRDS